MIENNVGPETTYNDNSVSASSKYNYRVKAVSPTGVSQWSGFVKANTPAAPDPAPTPTPTPTPEDRAPSNLAAALAEGGGVTLSWTAPAEDADSVTTYEILRAVGQEDLATLVSDTGSTATAYTDATATQSGATYTYQVKAIRGEEQSQASGQAQVQVPHDPVDLAPTNLAAASADDGIKLTWSAPAADLAAVTGYQVPRRRPNQGEDQLAVLESNTGSTATTYKDTGATAAGQTYVYGVRALRDDEPIQSSDVVEIKRPETAARAPSNLTGRTSFTIEVGQGDPDTSVVLNWAAPAEDGGSVTDYEIQLALDDAEFAALVADTSSPGTEYTDASPATPDEAGNYRYQVVALRPEGKSLPSNQWPLIDENEALLSTLGPDLGIIVISLDLDMTAVSLVKNTGQRFAPAAQIPALSLGSGEVRARRCLSFTTGANSSGYKLSSIGVSIKSPTSTAATDLTANVRGQTGSDLGSEVCALPGSAAYTNGVSDGAPGDVVCTLDNPASYSNDMLTSSARRIPAVLWRRAPATSSFWNAPPQGSFNGSTRPAPAPAPTAAEPRPAGRRRAYSRAKAPPIRAGPHRRAAP